MSAPAMTIQTNDEMLALADEYDAGTVKATSSGYMEFDAAFVAKRKMISDALRFHAAHLSTPQASRSASDAGAPAQCAPASEPVAWTNQAQLGFLKDPAYAQTPMAMWAARSAVADVALYASPHSGQMTDDDWRDDPGADDRWNAGVDFAMKHFCKVLGIEPDSFSWDAATETLDGDVMAVMGNMLRAKYGDDWDPDASWPSPGESRANLLIQQLAWYYRVNDCVDRHGDDAIEVPIMDLRAADEIARELGLPDGPAAIERSPAAPSQEAQG